MVAGRRVAALAALVLGGTLAAPPVQAQTCLEDLAGNVGCSANDVKITTITLQPGGLLDACTYAGDTATLNLKVEVGSGANRRYDASFFLARDGGDALTGSCEHEALIPADTLNSSGDPNSGSGPYANFDGDACGEIEQNVPTFRNVVTLTLPCTDSDNDGTLDINSCTTWRSSGSGACASVADALPSTGSKCHCEAKNIAGVTISNATTTTSTSTSTSTSSSSSSITTTTSSTSTSTSSSSTSSTLPNAPPTFAAAASATPNPVPGTTTALSVLGADDGGEATLTYTWAVTAGPAAVTIAPNGTNGAKDATATFTSAGTYTLQVTVTDQGSLTVTSSVTVTVDQTATSVTVTPATASVHVSATQAFTASLRDQFGAALAAQPAFAWGVSGGGTIAPSGVFTAGVTSGGPFTVTASDAGSGLSGMAAVTVVSDPPTIAAAASATPNPAPGTTTALSVLGADDGGEATLTYTWAATTGPAAVTIAPNGTNAAKGATATFTAAGTYTLQATVTDQDGLTVTSTVTVTVNQTATSVAVAPATANVPRNSMQAFTATLLDQFGTAMAAQPAFAWGTSGGGTIAPSGVFTAGATPGGPFTVTAGDAGSGLSGMAAVTVVSDPPTIAAAASATPNPVPGTTTALSVLGADDGGEATLTYTWAATAGPAPVTIAPNGTNGAKDATATFTAAGTYTLQATVTDLDGLIATSAVTVTVSQTATGVAVAPASAAVPHDTAQAFTATLLDQFGTAMAAQPAFAWGTSGGGTIAPSGVFTAGATPGGPFTVTASDAGSGLSGMAAVTVVSDPPTIATVASAMPDPATGTTTTLDVLGADDGGEPNLVYTWVETSGPPGAAVTPNGTNAARDATVTFLHAGTYTFDVTVTDQDGQTATSAVTMVVAQTLTAIQVSPPVTVGLNGTASFTASASDQFGDALATPPGFGWSVGGGSIDGSGTFIAGGSPGGPFTVTVTSGAVQGTSTVTVVDLPPSAAVPPAAAPGPVAGTTVALSVLGADDGGEANLTYAWSATGPGSVDFSPNGAHAARDTVATLSVGGVYTFTVTITDGSGQTAQASVVANAQGTLLVHDGRLYVKRARFTVDWKRHGRGRTRDRLGMTGVINPAGLPANLAGTTVTLDVNGTVLASGTLGAAGWYRSPAGAGPRVTITLSPRGGRYTVRLARADLRTPTGLRNATGTGVVVVPVTLTVSRARFAAPQNRLEFAYRSVAGRRARGAWRGPRQRLLDGAFQMLRTRAVVSRKIDAYVLRLRGVLYPLGSGPVIPSDDMTLQIGSAPAMVVPLAALRRFGLLPETSILKYRNADRHAPLASLVILNTTRRVKLRIGRMSREEMGMPSGAPVGSRADLPVRLDVPTADGLMQFQTTPELVRLPRRAGWKRPARLAQ